MERDDDLEIDPFLPAVFLGWRVDPELADRLRALADAPPWLVWFEHQYGGYATLQIEIAGALAPLALAPAPQGELDRVLAGLDALADDGSARVHRFAELRPLHLTLGKPYDAAAVEVLARFLARAFYLPAIARAHEAFVELVPCDLERTFAGWPLRARELPRASHLADPDAHDLVIGLPEVRDDRAIDARLVAAINELGVRLGLASAPRAFLVWINSD